MMRYLILALLLCACGSDPIDGQQEAQDYILGRYAQEGAGRRTEIANVVWYEATRCIPAPWDDEHPARCRVGRSWVIGPVCWVEVVRRGSSIGDTSFAHELLHCRLYERVGCPSHEGPEWFLVATVNDELLTMGL